MQTPAKVTIGVLVAAGMYLAGYMANRPPVSVASSDSIRQVLYYTCPMHPQYKLEKPGDCPSCGMRLVPVYAGGAGDKATPGSPGMIEVGPARQQSIGVRTDEVRRASASHLLRLLGRVTVDDARLYRLTAGTDGWVRVLDRNSAGAFVKKDQLLASYYAQNLLASAQTYVFALQSNPQAARGDATLGYQRTPTALNLQVALDTLRSLGMSDYQLEEIQKTREVPTLIHLYSPIAGFVIARNISPGQRFDKGAELYRIADIGASG
jgi:hypothetical protein